MQQHTINRLEFCERVQDFLLYCFAIFKCIFLSLLFQLMRRSRTSWISYPVCLFLAHFGFVLLATAAKLGIGQERGTRDEPSQQLNKVSRYHSWASVFRHPASQPGTGASDWGTLIPVPDSLEFRHLTKLHKVRLLKVAQLRCSVAQVVLRSSVENSVPQQGTAQLSRVQRSSVGRDHRSSVQGAAQLIQGAVKLSRVHLSSIGRSAAQWVQRSSVRCSVAQQSAPWLSKVQHCSEGAAQFRRGQPSRLHHSSRAVQLSRVCYSSIECRRSSVGCSIAQRVQCSSEGTGGAQKKNVVKLSMVQGCSVRCSIYTVRWQKCKIKLKH